MKQIILILAFVFIASGIHCQNKGKVSYKLIQDKNPNKDQIAAYKLITQIMDSAMVFYNLYTTATKKITVYYVPDNSVRADGNFNGNIRFGPDRIFMNLGTAIHEISHTIGIGTTSKWPTFGNFCVPSGQTFYVGKHAISQLRQITSNPNAKIFMDNQHFWPYGLNYAHEYTSHIDLINHCKIVNSMIKDGL